jgi:hypothetical protein
MLKSIHENKNTTHIKLKIFTRTKPAPSGKLKKRFFSLITIYILYWLNKSNLCSKPNSKSCRLVWAPITKLYNER